MKKLTLALFATLLSVAGTGHAQSSSSDITESTDPARAEEVLRRAADIQARQQSSQDMSSGDSGTTSKSSKRKSPRKPAAKSSAGSSGASGMQRGSGAGTAGDAVEPAGK